MPAPFMNLEADEETEIKKKIALYYHPLFHSTLAQWFLLLQQDNYSKLDERQYLDLNVRIQKSLILDFDLASAQASAAEDWKIDREREKIENGERQQAQSTIQDSLQQDEKSEASQSLNDDGPLEEVPEENAEQAQATEREIPQEFIEYERLSEFFFDLCLSWCQHLDIETYVFFLNGIFLNITEGSHANISTFKDFDDIQVLSVDFFNKLLEYRYRCDTQLAKGQGYAEWYSTNFGRAQTIAASVQNNLQEAFEGSGETRILDLFMDLPKEDENAHLQATF